MKKKKSLSMWERENEIYSEREALWKWEKWGTPIHRLWEKLFEVCGDKHMKAQPSWGRLRRKRKPQPASSLVKPAVKKKLALTNPRREKVSSTICLLSVSEKKKRKYIRKRNWKWEIIVISNISMKWRKKWNEEMYSISMK
jgi:hypothetical protein